MKEKFTTWLTESPVHVEEYLAIARVFGELTHVDPKNAIDLDVLVEDTIVALHGGVHAEPAAEPPARRRWAGFGLAASGLLAMIAAGGFYAVLQNQPLRYETTLGEQRSVLLEDGSMVSLNTSTAIEVDFGDESRHVRLLQGEALFDVEKDASRAFFVETHSVSIRVTGTQFNVYEQEGGTAVTVIEGRVEVTPRQVSALQETGSSSGTVLQSEAVAHLVVGDQVLVKSGSVNIETRNLENLEPVIAWTDRRLVFDATPLSTIVAEFNRYNHRRLVLDDATLATLELSGVFSSNDPEVLILFLERIAAVKVVPSADGSELRIQAALAAP